MLLTFPAAPEGDFPMGKLELTDHGLLIDCDVRMPTGVRARQFMVTWQKAELSVSDILDANRVVEFENTRSVRTALYRRGGTLLLPVPLVTLIYMAVVIDFESSSHALAVLGVPAALMLVLVAGIMGLLDAIKRKAWPTTVYHSNGIQLRTRDGTAMALSGRATPEAQQAFVSALTDAVRRHQATP